MRFVTLLLLLPLACDEEGSAVGQSCSDTEPCGDHLYCHEASCQKLKVLGEMCYVDDEGAYGGCAMSSDCGDAPTQLLCSVDTQGQCACPIQGSGVCGEAAKKLNPCIDSVRCNDRPGEERQICEDRVKEPIQALMAFLGLRSCDGEVEKQAIEYISCTLDEYCRCK